MTVFLLRHATRSAAGLGDTELNQIGLTQAETLAEELRPNGALPLPTRLYCSPKTRARQTLQPLAKACGIKLEVLEDLDEREQEEDGRAFLARIKKVLSMVAESAPNETVYLCTHLDWLEEALPQITSLSETSWSPGEYRSFEILDGVWNLRSRGRAATVRKELR